MVDSRCTFYQVGLPNSSTKREVMGLLQTCERGFKVEATCIWRGNPFQKKTLYKRESILTFGQSLLVYTLVRPLLPPPGHSYMEKANITVNKNILFTLGSNSKPKLNFFGQPKMQQTFYGRVSFSVKRLPKSCCSYLLFIYLTLLN